MDGGAWWAPVLGVTEPDTTERLSRTGSSGSSASAVFTLTVTSAHNASVKCNRMRSQKLRRRPDACHAFHPEVGAWGAVFIPKHFRHERTGHGVQLSEHLLEPPSGRIHTGRDRQCL